MRHFSAFCIRVIEEGRIGETNRIGGIGVLSDYDGERGVSEFEQNNQGSLHFNCLDCIVIPMTNLVRDKIVRTGKQKIRGNVNRNLILLISTMTMLTIIVGCTTPITFDQYSSTVISSYGLNLTLSLDSTTYYPGEQISITIDERNTLATHNNIPVADGWPVQGLNLGPCGTVYPLGISILQGYYDAKAVVGITPLQLFDPNVLPPCAPILPAVFYDFQPWSDVAAIYTSYDSQPSSIDMTANVTSAGFWTGSPPNASFSNFTPGIYTVVGGDEWGALVILHFTIS
jgi:hypothetical protein